MSDLLNIGLFLLIICGCVLIVYLVYVLRHVVETIGVLRTEITALRSELAPGIRSLTQLADETRETLELFEPHREALGAAVDNVKRLTGNVVRLQELVVDRIEPPLAEAASLLTGVMKGWRAFAETWKRRG